MGLGWFGRGKKGRATDPRAGELAGAAADALEAGRDADALAHAEEALALAPDDADVRRLHAGILVELGRRGEARAAYERALAAHGDDVALLADAAAFLVELPEDEQDRADLERAAALAQRGLKGARRDVALPDRAVRTAQLALAAGQALSALGDAGAALPLLAEAAAAAPDWVEPRLEEGAALYELCRFGEAEAALHEAEALAPDDAAVQHQLGLVLERRGDAAGARKRLARARRLDPEAFPEPVTLSAEQFDLAVEKALIGFPERVRDAIFRVSISVEDQPSDDDLRAEDPPLSPAILGLFRGPSLAEGAASGALPSIVLYQQNLQRFARDRAELVEEIRVTLAHEIGHYLGLDEDELYERGLE